MRLRLLAVAACLFPLPALGWGSARVCDALGTRIGGSLAAFLPALVAQDGEEKPSPHRVAKGGPADVPASRDPNLEGESRRELPNAKASKRKVRQTGSKRRALTESASATPRHGIRVSADSVLRLANSGARPRGTPVRATAERPAGLELRGVGALGLGLRDGDVLTHAGGRPARSEADVVAMILASRGAQAQEISGRFYRGGKAWNLIVEQPYLNRASRISAGSAVDRPRSSASERKVAALR